MKHPLVALIFSGCALAAAVHVHQSAFVAGPNGMPDGWTTWSARAETAPRAFIDSLHYRTKPGSLAISGASNTAEHGGWERSVSGIEAGAWYRFVAYYRAEAVPTESWQVVARLDWRNSANRRTGQPGYVFQGSGGGRRATVPLE